jgi:uncharacterized protein
VLLRLRCCILGLALVAPLGAAAPAAAAPLEVPALRARVNDLARLLPADRRAALEERLARFEDETAHQIVVLTVPSLEGEAIEDYSMRVAERWKIGHRGLDTGVIVVVVPADRAARIEVGYGLEGVIPDAVAARVLRERMVPLFRAGRMVDGVEAGIEALMAAARGEVIPPARRPRGAPPPAGGADPLALVLFQSLLASFVGAPFRRGRLRAVGACLGGGAAALLTYLVLRSLPWAALALALGALFGWFGPAAGGGRARRGGYAPGGFGGFSGRGGGFSGGGGGFGGGGASGRW